jgi:argininosuccinate synthase
MTDIKIPNSTSEFLDRLTDFLTDFPKRAKEEMRGDLLAKGVNPEQTVQRVQETVRTNLEEHRLSWLKQAKQERCEILAKLESIKPSVSSGKLEEIKDKIINILSEQFNQEALTEVHIHFRKLESITENDLISLLDDLESLELLDKSLDTDTEQDDSDE